MRRSAWAGLPLLLLLSGCGAKDEKSEAAVKPPEPVTVQTATAESRELARTLAVPGSLVPQESTPVSSEVPGRIESIKVDFGHDVRQGQVIAELDRQELNLALQRSQAALAQALARLGLNPDQADVRPELTPSIRQAKAQMEDAKSKYDTASQLVKSGDISQERFTEVQKQFQAREAMYEAARDEARTLLAQVQALKAEVGLARKRLGDAVVRAPFAGTISEKHASPGQYLKENTPIVTLVKTNPMRLRIEVPEGAAGAVRPGTTLTFSTDAVPDQQFQATVQELHPSLDPKSRTLTAEARIGHTDARLRPGMFVQVRLLLQAAKETVMVPKSAIYTVAGLNKLFLIRDGKAVEQRIQPGQEDNGWVEVPGEAVHPGDQVAVSQLSQLVEGTPVKAVPRG